MIVLSPSVHIGLMCPRGWPSSQQFKRAILLTHSCSPKNARSSNDVFNDDVPGIGRARCFLVSKIAMRNALMAKDSFTEERSRQDVSKRKRSLDR